jgi:hypothetical protein
MVGMMLHQDASTHAWLPGDSRKYDLVVWHFRTFTCRERNA